MTLLLSALVLALPAFASDPCEKGSTPECRGSIKAEMDAGHWDKVKAITDILCKNLRLSPAS